MLSPRNTAGHGANLDPKVPSHYSSPLQHVPAHLLPALALLLVTCSLSRSSWQLLPPFVTSEEADEVNRRRNHRVEQRLGRPIRLGVRGFELQRARLSKMATLALAGVFSWNAWASYTQKFWIGSITALTWSIIALRSSLGTIQTPPFGLLLALIVLLVGALSNVVELLPQLTDFGLFSVPEAFFAGGQLLLVLFELGLILAMPMAPGGWEAVVDEEERDRVQQGTVIEEDEDISKTYELCPTTPEDYTSLLSSLTYSWMAPLMKLSLSRPLLPSDIWRLRSINDTRMLYSKFRLTGMLTSGKQAGLTIRLLRANARDIVLDMCYTLTSVTLSYGTTYMMKLILEAIGEASSEDEASREMASSQRLGEWTPRKRAFVFASVSVLLQVAMYVLKLLNFHHARQVGLRIRSVMVAELYEKALKRRNLSHVDAHEPERPVSNEGGVKDKIQAAFLRRKHRRQDKAYPGETPKGTPPKADAGAGPKPTDTGKLVNMMSADVNVLLRLGCDFHQLSKVPVDIIVATLFLWTLLGWSALAGLSLLLLSFPLNYLAGKASVVVQRDWKARTDERMGLVTELLGAARFVKLQGVASTWRERILGARQKEIRGLYRVRYTQMAFGVLFTFLPMGVSLLSFFCYVKIQGNELTVPVAFTALTLFANLAEPLNTIPTFAMAILNAFVSVRRLESFLAEEEVAEEITALSRAQSLEGDFACDAFSSVQQQQCTQAVEIFGGTFSWRGTCGSGTGSLSPRPVLRDITVSFPPGVLSVIAGPTGSGKTSLLHAILGELSQVTGQLKLPKWSSGDHSTHACSGLSYAAQTPWLEGGKSIRENILFCHPMDETRYQEVLYACALVEDLSLFEEGDETRVSNTTLSGGQQARIGLARALYAPSHTILLDDPLAAVDARVQQHMVRHAFAGAIKQNRRILLVTHHFALVSSLASYLVYLKDGMVSLQGDVAELRRQGQLTGVLAEAAMVGDYESESSTASSSSPALASLDEVKRADATTPTQTEPLTGKTAKRLYQLEERSVGAVKWSVYAVYLRVSSPFLWAVIIALTLWLRAIGSSESYWLKIWGEASGDSGRRTGLIAHFPPAQGHENFYLGVYGLIGLSLVVFSLVRTLIFWMAAVRASQQLYIRLLSSVLSARLRFFDTNPLGRILQRFNQDVNVMDTSLPASFHEFIRLVPAIISNLVICGVIVPWFLVPAITFLIWFPRYFRGFLAATQDMQRIESTSTSPLYTAFASSMAGITTIRAFGAEGYRLSEMLTLLDVTQAQWWAICTIEVWGSFRCQISSGLAIFLVTMLALGGTVSAGSAGMVMSSAEMIAVVTYYLIENWKRLTNDLNSIERIVQYLDLPEEQANDGNKKRQPPAAWPTSSGTIHIEHMTIAYSDDLPDVLHDISLDINPGEKVGIVGRTGSGKTTLASSLFRAVEPKEGCIIIDGINIASLDVDALRRRLCIVPQSPVLFSGTVRSNLDPFDEKTDDECLWALRQVRIRASISKGAGTSQEASESTTEAIDDDEQVNSEHVMSTTLDAPVATGGANFSAGEAQLLSLARALLRDARVVVLDEATSSTDSEVDAAIQRAVRGMNESIVITVAHRLATVLDYDRIVVLSRGRIVETGSPAELLAIENGEFRSMAQMAGISV
ncbi:unnamed protein product [Parajaminaea phylloscopi]